VDLGIAGRKALVCGASSGLGLACARALVGEGVHVVLVARGDERLAQAQARLQALAGAAVVERIAADVSTEAGRARIVAAHPVLDILVTNAGGPPPGDFRQWTLENWHAALDANMLAPIALIRAYLDGMIERRWGRIVNLTSSAVKSPVEALGLSNGARAGLTGFVAGLARSPSAAAGVTINNLLPGTFDTPRLAGNFKAQAERQGRAVDEVITARLAKHPARRFGQPDELGALCAFLCSERAGYLNGQNLLLDGGSFAGVL
jgi:3-oxoacyl-[acyl-carrier protein] reductase